MTYSTQSNAINILYSLWGKKVRLIMMRGDIQEGSIAVTKLFYE